MRILPMTNPDELQEVALLVFRNALQDRKAKELMEQLARDPEVNPHTLLATAFCMGAASAISEMCKGRIVQLGSAKAYQSDS